MSKNNKNVKKESGNKPKNGRQGAKNSLGTSATDVSEVINSGRPEGKR